MFHGRVDAALDPELKKDLRAVHYSLGREPMVKRSTYAPLLICACRPSSPEHGGIFLTSTAALTTT